MPILSNPRWEMFAQELAKGKTADEAYQLAGYTENRGNAARLKANESVTERVKKLLAKAAEKHGVTVDRLVMELCIAALGTPADSITWTSKLNAIEKLGRHLGMFAEKIEHSGAINGAGDPVNRPPSANTYEEWIERRDRELGLDAAAGAENAFTYSHSRWYK
jgi:hypothetical protein